MIKYLTDKVGFVALSKMEPAGAVRLRLQPAIVADAALAAALYALLDDAPRRIVVSHQSDACEDELFADVGQAVDRVADLISRPPETRSEGAILGQRGSFASLVGAASPLARLLQFWIDKGRRLNFEEERDRLAELSNGRYMILEAKGDAVLICDIGDGFLSYNAHWRAAARGRPIEAQPDRLYGRFVGQFFRKALLQRHPRVDAVDAWISRPHIGDEIRLRYRMITLPFRSPSSTRRYLLGASTIDDSIDLRAEGERKVALGRH